MSAEKRQGPRSDLTVQRRPRHSQTHFFPKVTTLCVCVRVIVCVVFSWVFKEIGDQVRCEDESGLRRNNFQYKNGRGGRIPGRHLRTTACVV